MKPIHLTFIALLLAFACADHNQRFEFNGTHTGSFYRTRDNVRVIEADVSLSFEDGKFSGVNKEGNNEPAICRGTYTLSGREIYFGNECMFTANFDWTLILAGKFTVTETDDTIILAKEIDARNGDYYVLNKRADSR
ncbi:MAG TPA: hypothetical protein VGD65_06490 [Chryseosolibacter sp.]